MKCQRCINVRGLWAAFLTVTGMPFAQARPGVSFIEPQTPFLRSALVVENEPSPNRTRRGVIVPLGANHWACFDPDLLRWAAIWRSEPGQAPLSYDSMAAVSFPDAKAKAEKPPALRGQVLHRNPELPGVAVGALSTTDPRRHFLTDSKTPVGPLPLPHGQWRGISLRGRATVLEYDVAGVRVCETLRADASGVIQRCLLIEPREKELTFRLGTGVFHTLSPLASVRDGVLTVQPSKTAREILLHTSESLPQNPLAMPAPMPATPLFPDAIPARAPAPRLSPPFTIRQFALPETARPIRPIDIEFLADGTAILCTLDGDIWKISGLEAPQSIWLRIATGLYEPMALAIDPSQRVFVLGRDQITELIDTDRDAHIDVYRCASDAFFQTLHTRDFSTSLAIESDGSFLIAKGGIDKEGGTAHVELSAHRGTVLRIRADGQGCETLADGLRIPFVGLRNDGAIFVSDQQGNHIPSTPIHRLSGNTPYLGFAPTNFRKPKTLTEPLLYYPYQTNRSAAGFATASGKAFPDLVDPFLQVSWNGRLFPIATPASGRAFSWMLPLQLDFPSLNAATHPVSGRLYATGLGISGYAPTTPQIMGLASIEQSSSFPAPVAFEVSPNRIDLRFHRPLKADESVTAASLRLFNIQRSARYGSGHFLWNGKPGEHLLSPTALTLAADRRSLRIDFPLLRKSDVLDLQLSLTCGNQAFPLHLFSRPAHLPAASPAEIQSLVKADPTALAPGDAAKGKLLFTQFSCQGCHALDQQKLTGPSLQGIGARARAEELRESILNPAVKITPGYPPSMPSFAGVIPPQDIEHLIAYLLTLQP